MRARVALIALLAACGSHEPSAADKARAKATAACEKGEAEQCFVAAIGLDPTKKDQLQQSIELWQRGCELGHGASCAQLGTVAEFGMTSGGANPDQMGALRYYALGCKRGHAESCKRAGMPLPDGVADPDAKTPAQTHLAWREALTPICGKGRAELGPLFDGLVLGQPMPGAMKQQVAAFEKKYKARVHYSPDDPTFQTPWNLDVWFAEKDGIEKVLALGWGEPDLSFGAWASDKAHVMAYWLHNDRESGVAWTPYRSAAEVIRVDDPDTLGFEPGFPVVGRMLADLQNALGGKLLRTSEDEYRWNEIGPGPSFEVHVIAKHGVIVELRTVNWITNSPALGDTLLGALETKWGPFKLDKDGARVWQLKGRRVRASKPASGNFEIVITKR